MGLDVSIAGELRGRVRLGVAVVAPVTVREADPGLDAALEEEARALRERHAGRPASELPEVAETRSLYRSLGLDPTKTRPSSEALLRRVLKGESLYRVSTLVDVVNLVSLRHQLPFGLYDLDRLQPPLELRLGRAEERYEGIRKGELRATGRPVLADASGPFGNPSADSLRSAIRLETRRALVVAYAAAGAAPARVAAALDDATRSIERHCGGSASERRLLPEEPAA